LVEKKEAAAVEGKDGAKAPAKDGKKAEEGFVPPELAGAPADKAAAPAPAAGL